MIYVAVVPSKKARHLNMQQRVRTREQRAELRQKKYRYLYQVRTAHGDVISQVGCGFQTKFIIVTQTVILCYPYRVF
jgi:hypothetical protein